MIKKTKHQPSKSSTSRKTVSRRAKLSKRPDSNLPARGAPSKRRSPKRSDSRSSSVSTSPPAPTTDDAIPTRLVSGAGGSSRKKAPEVGVLAADGTLRLADADLGISSATPSTEHLILAEIKEMHRRRQAWHKAEKTLILQTKAIERRLRPAEDSTSPAPLEPGVSLDGGGRHDNVSDTEDQIIHAPASTSEKEVKFDPVVYYATYPLVQAREFIKKHRLVAEKRLQTLARQLPLYAAFVEPISGFGALGFSQILGEAGDLTNYSNPAKLWKRMGVAVINGQRQRRVAGPEALVHGYDAERRSVLWNIGDSLLKKQNHYKDVYSARKLVEIQKAETEGLQVLPQATIDREKGTAEAKRSKYRSLGHIHNRSKRYAEKRLLRDLWRAARALKRNETPASPKD